MSLVECSLVKEIIQILEVLEINSCEWNSKASSKVKLLFSFFYFQIKPLVHKYTFQNIFYH